MEPWFVRKVMDETGKVLYRSRPTRLASPIEEDTARTLKILMTRASTRRMSCAYPTSYIFSNVITTHTIDVVYEIDTNMITTSVVGGTITPTIAVDYDAEQTITYSADANYHLVSVTVDSTPVDIWNQKP